MSPRKARKPCKYLGCPKLTEDKYCDEHQKIHIKDRANATERGYDSKWRIARAKFLKVKLGFAARFKKLPMVSSSALFISLMFFSSFLIKSLSKVFISSSTTTIFIKIAVSSCCNVSGFFSSIIS